MGSRTFNIGLTGLPDDKAYDLKVVLKDNNDNTLDSRIVKVPYSEKMTTRTAEVKSSFKMAGKSFTLQNLLAKEKDLQKLLDENDMEDLKVQVKEQ